MFLIDPQSLDFTILFVNFCFHSVTYKNNQMLRVKKQLTEIKIFGLKTITSAITDANEKNMFCLGKRLRNCQLTRRISKVDSTPSLKNTSDRINQKCQQIQEEERGQGCKCFLVC